MEFLNREQVKNIITNLKPANILFAITSTQDYSMDRTILIENLDPYDYIILTGCHCSCYGFEETEWEASTYNEEEIKKLSYTTWKTGSEEEIILSNFINNYFG
jgi:hypothetical protein